LGVGLEELDGSDGEEEALVEREVILEPRDLLTRWEGTRGAVRSWLGLEIEPARAFQRGFSKGAATRLSAGGAAQSAAKCGFTTRKAASNATVGITASKPREKRVTGSRGTDLLAGAAVRGLGVHERELIFEELFARRVVPVRRLGRGPCRGWGEDLHRNRHS